jgi:hypothetical protein
MNAGEGLLAPKSRLTRMEYMLLLNKGGALMAV